MDHRFSRFKMAGWRYHYERCNFVTSHHRTIISLLMAIQKAQIVQKYTLECYTEGYPMRSRLPTFDFLILARQTATRCLLNFYMELPIQTDSLCDCLSTCQFLLGLELISLMNPYISNIYKNISYDAFSPTTNFYMKIYALIGLKEMLHCYISAQGDPH